MNYEETDNQQAIMEDFYTYRPPQWYVYLIASVHSILLFSAISWLSPPLRNEAPYDIGL